MMMMVRRTALTFLMLASLMLVAHAVIPHHHHGNIICLKRAHCHCEGPLQEDHPADDRKANHHNHTHDGEDNSGDCVLRTPVGVFDDELKITFTATEQKADHADAVSLLPATPSGCLPDEAPSGTPKERVQPGRIFYHSIITNARGLRAPPAA